MITADVVTVTDEETLLSVSEEGDPEVDRNITLRNTGPVAISLGIDSVAYDNGWTLDPEDEISFDLEAGEEVYGLATEPCEVRVYQNTLD